MKTRLKSCDRWHPGEVSEIREYPHKGRGKAQERCLKCVRVEARMRYYGMIGSDDSKPEYRVYGVLPSLDWDPPNVA